MKNQLKSLLHMSSTKKTCKNLPKEKKEFVNFRVYLVTSIPIDANTSKEACNTSNSELYDRELKSERRTQNAEYANSGFPTN